VFSRAESLELEPDQMKELSKRLAAIPRTKDPAVLEEAKGIISRLHSMNLRWNIPELKQFLLERQKELFY
jgi:hypothetical protein